MYSIVEISCLSFSIPADGAMTLFLVLAGDYGGRGSSGSLAADWGEATSEGKVGVLGRPEGATVSGGMHSHSAVILPLWSPRLWSRSFEGSWGSPSPKHFLYGLRSGFLAVVDNLHYLNSAQLWPRASLRSVCPLLSLGPWSTWQSCGFLPFCISGPAPVLHSGLPSRSSNQPDPWFSVFLYLQTVLWKGSGAFNSDPCRSLVILYVA